jgi:uncharacterized membrane protein YozB (DUF420 family)
MTNSTTSAALTSSPASTPTKASRTSSRRPFGWRLLLVASAVTAAAGGGMHPDSDPSDSLRERLATMTADDRWVVGHTIIVVSTVLLALGLRAARRAPEWSPAVRRALTVASVAVGLYVIETVAHLAAVIDSDALASGESAPVAWSHVALSAILYPLSGWAVALLALAMARGASVPRKVVAGIGLVAGVVHAASIPLMPDLETSRLFPVAAIGLAFWSLGTGLLGAPRRTKAPVEVPAQVAA